MSSQVVIVTGAASGIGAAIALSFAKLNAGLCITDINEEDLHKTGIECQKLSKTKVLEVIADLTKNEDLENIVKSALKEFERIDVLVNSAGIFKPTNIRDSDIIEKFDKIFEVNLRSLVSLTNKTLPSLIKSKGCVINLSSVANTILIDDGMVYSMTKAGVTMFTKYAAFELARLGVRVNSINPGPVKTNIFLNAMPQASEVENNEYWNKFAEKVAMKKCIKAEEIGEIAVYLASDKAESITGSEFVVDAGMMLGNARNYNNTN